jgi:hypothetical protein
MNYFPFKKLRVQLREDEGPLRPDTVRWSRRRVIVFVVDRVLPDATCGQWESGWLVETRQSLRDEDGSAWFASEHTGLVYDENNDVVGISRHLERHAEIEMARERKWEQEAFESEYPEVDDHGRRFYWETNYSTGKHVRVYAEAD